MGFWHLRSTTYSHHNWYFTHRFIDDRSRHTVHRPSHTDRTNSTVCACALPTFRWIDFLLAHRYAGRRHLWIRYRNALDVHFDAVTARNLKLHGKYILCAVGQSFVQHVIEGVDMRCSQSQQDLTKPRTKLG